MSKLVLLGDTHFGAHSSSLIHHEYMRKFYADFFQYVDENKIQYIIQLGDLFDVRKHINTWSLNFFREVFLKPVIERDLHVHVLLGNHDIYFRESVAVSSVEEVLMPYQEWFTIVKEPVDTVINGHSFLMVPWVCKENADQVNEAIKSSKSRYCAGHFEFDGFELFKGQMAKSHYKHNSYEKFKTVFSGHYHAMSSRDNVVYTGTPYELTWQDANTSKGFFTLDDKRKLTFEENPHKLYVTLNLASSDEIDNSQVREKILKVKLLGPWEPKQREALLDNLYSLKPHSIKLLDSQPLVEETAKTEDVVYDAATGVDSLITDYITNIHVNDNIDKSKLNHIMLEILNEATA